jgi:uncharacterized protein
MSEWLCIIRPPRPTFIEDASPEEQDVMREHFAYLKSLLQDGKLILAGPSLDPPFGIIVLEAETEDEARRLVAADPSPPESRHPSCTRSTRRCSAAAEP